MLDLGLGSTVCLQHKLSGTGVFNGSTLGYAKYTYSSGGASFVVRSRALGTEGNAYSIQLVNVGTGREVTTTTAKLEGVVLKVYLKRTTSAITATATEVVNAINALPSGNKFIAALVTAATIPAALAATPLTGGLDATGTAGLYKFTPAANTAGGLFYFDQKTPWFIRGFAGSFSGVITPTVSIVNVDDGLNVVSGESIVVYSQSLAGSPYDFTYASIELPLLPGQALLVSAAAQGVVRVYARPEGMLSRL